MSDGVDRIASSKNSVLFLILSKLLKRVNFNLLMRNKSMENMRLILDEVIMLDRHMSDGKLYLFLQLFFQH